MLWQILVAVFILWTCIVQWRRRKYYHLAQQFKIDYTAYPIIGHAYKFIGNDENRMATFQLIGRQALKTGGMSSAWLGHRLFIVVADPANADFVLKTCLEKDDVAQMMKFVIDNGSIFAPVAIWRPRRKILIPSFSAKNLAHFVKIFAKQSAVMVQQLKKEEGTGPFPLWSYMTTYTMDSVCETTLGLNLQTQMNPDHMFLKSFEEFSELISSRMVQPWLHSNLVYRFLPACKRLTHAKEHLDSFVNEIIKLKKTEYAEIQAMKHEIGKINSEADYNKTFLELLIQSSGGQRGYSDEELKEEIMVIIMAGTDTSAVGTSFIAVMLSQHQDVQEKVYKELREVFGDIKRPVTPADLPQLKYLEAVIKESLRLYPPVPVIVRKLTTDVTLSSGITLIKGCGILCHIWAIHRNQKYWGADAEDFRPERFLDSRLQHPAQFIAFSCGIRNCAGYQYAMMSAKTAIATLLLNYKILPANHPKPNGNGSMEHDPLRLKFDIMMKDVDNYMVALEAR